MMLQLKTCASDTRYRVLRSSGTMGLANAPSR